MSYMVIGNNYIPINIIIITITTSDDVNSKLSEWEKMMHCKRFYIYTNNDNDHDNSINNTDGLMRYSLSIDRAIHVTSLSNSFFDREILDYGSKNVKRNEQLLGKYTTNIIILSTIITNHIIDISSAMYWISPCTLGFIEDAEIVNAAEACANVMHVQTLVLSNIVTSLKYHNSLNETERRAAPFGNIVGLIPTMTAAITNLANMTGFHNGILLLLLLLVSN